MKKLLNKTFDFLTRDRLIRIALFLVIIQLSIWIIKPVLKYFSIYPYKSYETLRKERGRAIREMVRESIGLDKEQ